MKLVKQIGLIALGGVIGVLATASIRAQAQSAYAPPRLVFHQVTTSQNKPAYIVKDTKSSGCWLSLGDALSPAPEYLCNNDMMSR
jgi:hypothetical protein